MPAWACVGSFAAARPSRSAACRAGSAIAAWSGRWLRHRASSASTLRSEEHTSELQSLMRISYAVFCLKKKKELDTQPNMQYKLIQTTTTEIPATVLLHNQTEND